MKKNVILLLSVSVAVLAVAVPTQAKPGDGKKNCPGTSSQVFAEYNDHRTYSLAPGGDFEALAPGWELAEGASLQTVEDDTALVLEPDASAVSAPICVTKGHPSARMFGAAQGKKSGVRIDVLYGDREHPVGNANLKAEWRATRSFSLAKGGFRLDPGTRRGQIRLRFTAIGDVPAMLDDLYIDPRRRS